MTRIVIEIGCEPGSETCLGCHHHMIATSGDGDDGEWCQVFRRQVAFGSDIARRCDACKSAERAAIGTRRCGCANDSPPCHCENDQ